MKFSQVLESRINPEKSRNFSRERFEAGLERLKELAQQAGLVRPESSIQVVGTNGKGTTSWFLSAILSRHFRTGLYTSPHLLSYTERIRVNGVPVSEDDLEAACSDLANVDLSDLTYFELLTIVAGKVFSRARTEFQIYEAGLGGRLDATHIFQGRNVLLTRIDLDHQNVLGSTPEQILREKLGIASSGARIIMMKQKYFSREEVAQQTPCPLIEFPESLESFRSYLDYNKAFARFAAMQIAGVDSDDLPPMPGRLEVRRKAGKTLVYDHAHNPAAIEEVMRSLKQMPDFPGEFLVLAGVLPDRDAGDCLKAARSTGGRLLEIRADFFQAPGGESIPIEELASVLAAPEEWIVFLGSHRLYSAYLGICL